MSIEKQEIEEKLSEAKIIQLNLKKEIEKK